MTKAIPVRSLVLVLALALLTMTLTACGPSSHASTFQEPDQSTQSLCIHQATGAQLTYQEAFDIARSSQCTDQGNLRQAHFCNESTGTWWIDLDIEKAGCSPACVVSVIDRTAEINWRCTGLLPQK